MVDPTASGSMPTVQEGHRVGDWAVIKGSWRLDVQQITKVTAKQIRTRRHGDREAHHLPSEVVFSGTEQQARDLYSVLIGLDARNDQARQQLADQHRARVAAAIARATGAQ